jgi:hypothetical protein
MFRQTDNDDGFIVPFGKHNAISALFVFVDWTSAHGGITVACRWFVSGSFGCWTLA